MTRCVLSGRIFRDDVLAGGLGRLLEASTPTGRIAAPLLIVQGGADQLVLPAAQQRFVAGWCARGQAVDHRVFPGLDHVPLAAPGSPLVPQLLTWTQERLASVPAESTCRG